MAEKQESKDNRIQELEKAYERHKKTAEKAKEEYNKVHERLIGRLSAEHLEPIATALLEHDNTVLDTEAAIKSVQQKLRDNVIDPWMAAYDEHIGPNVAKLEMLKEHYKEFEGTDWQLSEKTVEDRTEPVRIEFKLKKLHWLQKQVEQQNEIIRKKTEEILEHRSVIQEMSKAFVQVTESINSTDIEGKKKEMMAILNDERDNVLNEFLNI